MDKVQTASEAALDSQLWVSMLECMTEDMDTRVTVLFQDGAEVSV